MERPDYERRRAQAHELAAEDAETLLPGFSVRITGIDASTLAAYASTWSGLHPSGFGHFDWPYLWHRYCRQELRSFHCALWCPVRHGDRFRTARA